MFLARNESWEYHVVFKHRPAKRTTVCTLVAINQSDRSISYEYSAGTVCSKNDQFDRRIGRVVSLGRAIDQAAAGVLAEGWTHSPVEAIRLARQRVIPLYLSRMPQDRTQLHWLEAYSGDPEGVFLNAVYQAAEQSAEIGGVIEVVNEPLAIDKLAQAARAKALDKP